MRFCLRGLSEDALEYLERCEGQVGGEGSVLGCDAAEPSWSCVDVFVVGGSCEVMSRCG